VEKTLSILGIGSSHASEVITNRFLEDLDTGTNCAWIEEKIGILERVTTLPLDYIRSTRNADPRAAKEAATSNSTNLGIAASKEAIGRAGISPSDIGLVICNCCVPVETIVPESQRIAEGLGIECSAFDVFTACPAFALHMDFLRSYDESALPDYILCISTATMTHHVNYNDRTDGAIWGDGAAAWVVSPRHRGKLEILDSFFAADPTRWAAVCVDTGAFFRQDGRAVRDFSVRQTVRLIKSMEERKSIDWSRDVFVGHQANRTMLEQIVNNRKIPPESHWFNVTYLGNQAAAGAPATLAMRWGDLQPDRFVVMAVVGAGLSWGSTLLRVC
jgi:3-oxoacyl-[acyl-carrier-protein] synthase-3